MRRWFTEQAKSRPVEIIHSHGLWMMPNVYPGIVAKRHDVPLVISPRGALSEWAFQHGAVIKPLFWFLVQKPALTATSCFHATSESEYKAIRRMGFRQPIAIIPNGIDIPAFARKRSQHHRTLLFLGRVHPSKGLDMLLPSWQAVQKRFPDWRLKIAGPDNGGYLSKMQHLAAQLHLERIEFVGALKGKQKWQAYQEADIFVLPTYSENFGMTVAEALAAGLPAIVSKGAPWEGLEQKKAGWWIDVGPDPLVTCLNHALSQPPDTLAEMGERGRAWMQAEFSWKQVAAMMDQTYLWILKGGTAPDWVRKR
jgi:glycosyltransferase involved in cell wall biosynthesis